MEKIKRTIALRIICTILIIAYIIFIIWGLIKPFNLHKAWFSIALNFLGAILITKSVFFNLDSSMFLGVSLYFMSFIGIVHSFVLFENLISYYFLAFSCACLVVFFIFRQNIHFNLFALSLLEVIILILIKNNFSLAIFWIAQGGFIAFILSLIMVSIIKAKERKSAVSK